jgi:LuxR family transcriptional regulator, maltose regulon positive regulatory protein
MGSGKKTARPAIERRLSPRPRRVALAKITMPTMRACVPRVRLNARLDELASFPVVWVSAPAGYGKTAAVSSYLSTRRLSVAWYLCDEGDVDIASFFHYMALAGGRSPEANSLPVFLPQNLSAVAAFCRNFFRQWFAGLESGSTLVLDNWEVVPPESELHSLLPVVAQQVLPGQQLIVISRTEPDHNVSRLILNERLAQLRIEDLQLSRTETEEIARARVSEGDTSETVDVETLYRITQGWAAAVTLLLRHVDLSMSAAQHAPAGESQAIFDYLATEAFQRLPSGVREFLVKVACLDHISVSVACKITGCAGAASILENLTRQNIFTAYRASSNSYYLHPLFRRFLQREQDKTISRPGQRELLRAAANALGDQGDFEASLNLLLQAECWNEAADLLRRVAGTFVGQSRLTTVFRAIDCLPSQLVTEDAALLYWRGVCRVTFDFANARSDLERSFDRFLATDDRLGQALACAAILHHIAYSYHDYAQLLPWIDRMERLLDGDLKFGSAQTEIKVRAGFMLALSQGIPRHPKLAVCIDKVRELVKNERDIHSLADGVAALLHVFSGFGIQLPDDLGRIVKRLLHDTAFPSIYRMNLLWLHAYQLHSRGEHTQVFALLEEARDLAEQDGLESDIIRMRVSELQAQEFGSSTAATLATFSELEPFSRHMPPIPRSQFLYSRSIFELRCGNLSQAVQFGEEALPLIRAAHWLIGTTIVLTGLAEIYCAAGRLADADRCLEECAQITEGVFAPFIDFNVQLLRAELARISDSPDFRHALARAFAIGRENGYASEFNSNSQILRRAVASGLELGIEPSYCHWVIGKRRFSPPTPYQENWPWPVKIRAMGRLRILIDGEELVAKGSAKRKPLEVLKLLCAHPHGVEISQVMDEIWSDLDGDAARNALDVTLHRLRKMLKQKQSVEAVNGWLFLNKDVVWLDTAAFDSVGEGAASEANDNHEEVLALYRGELLGNEDARGMVLAARRRIQAKFVDRVSQLAQQLEDSCRWEEATSLYARAVERSPDESLQRRLFRAKQNLGDQLSREER